jgi:hypothetical protein
MYGPSTLKRAGFLLLSTVTQGLMEILRQSEAETEGANQLKSLTTRLFGENAVAMPQFSTPAVSAMVCIFATRLRSLASIGRTRRRGCTLRKRREISCRSRSTNSEIYSCPFLAMLHRWIVWLDCETSRKENNDALESCFEASSKTLHCDTSQSEEDRTILDQRTCFLRRPLSLPLF